MAQNPILADQLDIEPGAAGTRRIRKATDGSLEFLDALITGGVTLSRLAGLRNVQNVLIVGKAGAGAAYTTIQAALDAIPVGASWTAPYLVLVCPGVYTETVNIARNGVAIVGLGAVTIRSLAEDTPDGVGAYHTIVVQAAG
ncbi:hypothetical protein HWQ67_19060, partial [Candidatus Magnetobacterium casensis]